MLYSDIESVLRINGDLCAPLCSCALLGMLYALSLEPLLQKICSSVCRFFFPGFKNLSAWADDVVVLIKNQEDVNTLAEITEKFSIVSLAKVNWGKSQGLAVGEWHEGLPVLPQNLAWQRDSFKYLSIFLGLGLTSHVLYF